MTTNKLRFVETDTKSVEQRKKELRAYMKARRGENENRDVKETLLIENFLSVLAELFGAKQGAGTRLTGFIYLSYSSEAPTDKLIEICEEKGVEVYCPRVENGRLVAVKHGEDMTLSAWGIREPTGAAFAGELDFALVPLLAADEKGNRLGYGGGYYDRYLREKPQIKRIGYGFDFQLLSGVPHTQTDEKLDVIVTDKRVIYSNGKNGVNRGNTK